MHDDFWQRSFLLFFFIARVHLFGVKSFYDLDGFMRNANDYTYQINDAFISAFLLSSQQNIYVYFIFTQPPSIPLQTYCINAENFRINE